MYVHNLSAVGEQYLDFEPADDKPPYAEDGDTLHGDATSLPVDEGVLLVELNSLRLLRRQGASSGPWSASSGTMFHDTGEPLQQLLDDGSTFVDEASPTHGRDHRALLDDGLTVLQTQAGQSENIRSFADDLARITRSLQGQRRGPPHDAVRRPRHRDREVDRAAHRARADAARAAGQPRPASVRSGDAPRRRSSSCWWSSRT